MKNKRPLVLGLDFDETLSLFKTRSKSKIGRYIPKDKIDSVPNFRVVSFIKKLRRLGVKIIIYSSRWHGDYNTVKDWLRLHKIVVDGIVLGRMKCDAYLCDKSVNAHDENMEDNILKLLKEPNSWGKYSNANKKV